MFRPRFVTMTAALPCGFFVVRECRADALNRSVLKRDRLDKDHLVFRFRSSHDSAAASFANFGIEGHQQRIDLVWRFRNPHNEFAAMYGADF
jgi:hypothetical protein